MGQDIFDRVKETITSTGLRWDKLCSVTTDGAPNMTGAKAGLVAGIRQHCEEQGCHKVPVSFHCIVHQEALASMAAHFGGVMKIVTDTVNFLRSRGLKHKKFSRIFEDPGS